MRLIDACQLIENLKNYLIEDAQKGGVMIACGSFAQGLATACKLADTADVIDPVKHGHWTRYDRWCNGYAYICSECGKITSSNKDEHLEYCCHCGTKMDGDK